MKGELKIYFLLTASLAIVLLFGTNVQTARIVTLHELQNGSPSQYMSLQRDSSKEKRVQNNDVLKKYKMDIVDKRSAPERIPEFSTKINEQSVFDNLVRKSQERFPSAHPRLYQSSQFAQKEPTSSNVQYSEIPVVLYDKISYTTPSVNAETRIPIQENAINHALTGKLEPLQSRQGKNTNMESNQQFAQMSSIPSLCTSEKDQCMGVKRRRTGPRTPRPKSVNEVYGLAVKAERKYEEGVSTDKGGCVKFSEMSAELLSELERMEKFGNVKMEPREEIPSVLKLLTSTECDQAALVSGRSMGAAAEGGRQGKGEGEGDVAGAPGAASASQAPAALPSAPERRPLRGARAQPQAPDASDAADADAADAAAGEVAARSAAEDADAAFKDIAVSLGGGYPALGRSAVD